MTKHLSITSVRSLRSVRCDTVLLWYPPMGMFIQVGMGVLVVSLLARENWALVGTLYEGTGTFFIRSLCFKSEAI
jgi:hypothetical protein